MLSTLTFLLLFNDPDPDAAEARALLAWDPTGWTVPAWAARPQEEEAAGDAATAEEAVEEEEKPPHYFGFDWSGTISAGITAVAGNSKSTTAYADLEFTGKRMDDDWQIDQIAIKGGYIGARDENRDTGDRNSSARNYRGSFKYDYFLTKKTSVFGLTAAERDGPRALNLGFTANAGLNYWWLKEEDYTLSTGAGLGYTSLDYKDRTSDSDFISGLIELRADVKLSENASFFHTTIWIPSLQDFDEDHIVRTETGVRAGLLGNLSLEGKVIFDWDSSPATGNKRQDVKYIGGLSWAF